MSGFDQSSIAVSMPTVVGADAALGGPYKIKPSEAFSGALMTVSGLTGETISVETSPDGYWGAPASPDFYRTDWQGTQPLYSTARTNLVPNSLWVGGGDTPTNWSSGGTGTSTPVASIIGGPGTAYSFVAAAQRPYVQTGVVAATASTSYCLSMVVEATDGICTINQCLGPGVFPVGSTRSYPPCEANPSGGNSIIRTGVAICILTIDVTPGNITLRCGPGVNGNYTGSITVSHPQLEVGTTRTSFIATPVGASATITDYTLSNGVITLAETPVTGATLSYDNSVLPSPYYIFATGDGVRTTFAYDGVWGTLSANSGKGNGIWQVDLRGAQAYRLVKSAGSETATVNMTLKRDALQYTNSAGTWSVT